MSANKILFHIDINAFFASAEEANDPSLKDKPIVVGGKTKRSVVASPNYKARSYGIKAGMPLFMAKSLCPNVVIVEHKFELYEEYSRRFFNLLREKISNRIEYLSIDECYMDVTNFASDYESAIKLSKKIQNLVKKEIGFGVSIGISYNRFLAKMGSDYKKPMGITVIKDIEDIKRIIWPQPIGNMYFVGKSSEQKLIDSGIKTIGQLAVCKDQELLESIFGKNWESFINNANGIGDDELVYSYGEPKSVSISRTLLNDSNDFNEIKMYLISFAKDIEERLKYYDLAGKTLSVYIKDTKFKFYTKSLTIDNYINEYHKLIFYYLDMYEKYFSKKTIRLIGAGISNLKKCDEIYLDSLFNNDIPKSKKNKLNEIVDDINEKFSKDLLGFGTKLK